MIKFLHVGDIHLGYRQYKLLEREQDFFRAFLDACQKGGIEAEVDFVLVTGDLFNYRNISPQTFNEATYVFNRLKQAGIPVIAIEGNHDFKEAGTFNNVRGSWFEALAQNQLIYFLNPLNNEEAALEPLIENKKYLGGGYIDLERKRQIIRIIGSRWQGFNAGAALPLYVNRIQKIQDKADFTVFMFHAGHENYLPVNRGGVSGVDFRVLEGCVDYVALGHIHEHYILQDSNGKNFIYNPGSLEANASSEVNIERGA
ncbi:MAG: DNA repair exonuclease, partial [Candidatus Caenarcaniphilales bacterium]|nr:DNA repair exonuclease [Candidatus Caenarcaniphilales bacterium]